ncbi:MAG: glycogen-binding domain-containing protein [Treponema sp.]|nr:glycogen-binding domain-containing protein [Treponema sp.]
MRKICIFSMAFSLFFAGFCSAAYADDYQRAPVVESDVFADIASSINKVSAPYMKGDYVIFTQKKDARYMGIAFDFEKYRTIHQFQIKHMRDSNYEIEDSLYFYILKLPKNVQVLNYRLVVDGLWTTDPMNSTKKYNAEAGLVLSQLNVSRRVHEVTEKKETGKVRFVYNGKSGEQVRLGGSFTNWDSWIYEMTEVAPGQYQIDLALPPGQYQYAYYCGVKSYPDKTNPERCYTPDGKEASLLIVK